MSQEQIDKSLPAIALMATIQIVPRGTISFFRFGIVPRGTMPKLTHAASSLHTKTMPHAAARSPSIASLHLFLSLQSLD